MHNHDLPTWDPSSQSNAQLVWPAPSWAAPSWAAPSKASSLFSRFLVKVVKETFVAIGVEVNLLSPSASWDADPPRLGTLVLTPAKDNRNFFATV